MRTFTLSPPWKVYAQFLPFLPANPTPEQSSRSSVSDPNPELKILPWTQILFEQEIRELMSPSLSEVQWNEKRV